MNGQYGIEIPLYLAVFHKILVPVRLSISGMGQRYPAIAIISTWTAMPRLML